MPKPITRKEPSQHSEKPTNKQTIENSHSSIEPPSLLVSYSNKKFYACAVSACCQKNLASGFLQISDARAFLHPIILFYFLSECIKRMVAKWRLPF